MGDLRGGTTIAGYIASHLGNLLDHIKTILPSGKGNGSGIDVDTVDGRHASDFAPSGFGLGTNGKDISNSNLNSLLTTGFYIGVNLANAPTNGWYYITVISHSPSWCVQYITGFGPGSTNNAPANMYIRNMRSGTWDSWQKEQKGVLTWNDLEGK